LSKQALRKFSGSINREKMMQPIFREPLLCGKKFRPIFSGYFFVPKRHSRNSPGAISVQKRSPKIAPELFHRLLVSPLFFQHTFQAILFILKSAVR